jgi:hypothetical protein
MLVNRVRGRQQTVQAKQKCPQCAIKPELSVVTSHAFPELADLDPRRNRRARRGEPRRHSFNAQIHHVSKNTAVADTRNGVTRHLARHPRQSRELRSVLAGCGNQFAGSARQQLLCNLHSQGLRLSDRGAAIRRQPLGAVHTQDDR